MGIFCNIFINTMRASVSLYVALLPSGCKMANTALGTAQEAGGVSVTSLSLE